MLDCSVPARNNIWAAVISWIFCFFTIIKAACTLAPKYPRSVGLRNLTSNTGSLRGKKRPIAYSRYEFHVLKDSSVIIE